MEAVLCVYDFLRVDLDIQVCKLFLSFSSSVPLEALMEAVLGVCDAGGDLNPREQRILHGPVHCVRAEEVRQVAESSVREKLAACSFLHSLHDRRRF